MDSIASGKLLDHIINIIFTPYKALQTCAAAGPYTSRPACQSGEACKRRSQAFASSPSITHNLAATRHRQTAHHLSLAFAGDASRTVPEVGEIHLEDVDTVFLLVRL